MLEVQGGRRRCEKNHVDDRESEWTRETDGGCQAAWGPIGDSGSGLQGKLSA